MPAGVDKPTDLGCARSEALGIGIFMLTGSAIISALPILSCSHLSPFRKGVTGSANPEACWVGQDSPCLLPSGRSCFLDGMQQGVPSSTTSFAEPPEAQFSPLRALIRNAICLIRTPPPLDLGRILFPTSISQIQTKY